MELTRARRQVMTSVAAVGLIAALAGCGGTGSRGSSSSSSSSSSTSSSSTTASSQECADAAKLKSSLESLTSLQASQLNKGAVSSAVTKIKSDLDAAVASASGALKPNVDAVKTAVDQLQTATAGVTANNFTQKLPAIVSAVQQVGTAASALGTTLQQDCPGM